MVERIGECRVVWEIGCQGKAMEYRVKGEEIQLSVQGIRHRVYGSGV
jgi:hypothetical protein